MSSCHSKGRSWLGHSHTTRLLTTISICHSIVIGTRRHVDRISTTQATTPCHCTVWSGTTCLCERNSARTITVAKDISMRCCHSKGRCRLCHSHTSGLLAVIGVCHSIIIGTSCHVDGVGTTQATAPGHCIVWCGAA